MSYTGTRMLRCTFLASAFPPPAMRASRDAVKLDIGGIESARVLKVANRYLSEAPEANTISSAKAITGGPIRRSRQVMPNRRIRCNTVLS